MDTPDLRYALEEPSPLDDHVLAVLAGALGLRAVRVDAASRPILYRGASPPPGWEGIVVAPSAEDVLWRELIDGGLEAESVPLTLPFDLIGAAGRLLTDAVNADRGAAARDRHGRLRFAASFQAEHGLAEVPIVNRYAQALGALLRRAGGPSPRPPWPEGRRAAIGLSHDVDRPYKWAILRAFREGRLPRPSMIPAFAGRVLYTAIQRARRGAADDFWLFEPLIADEESHGLRSTFFFSAMPAYGPWGTMNDVFYDAAWTRFAPVFARLTDAGFGIGLHAGFEAYRSLERLVAERERLRGLTGTDVPGLRHHFWHLGPDEAATLRLHEAAGFEFDSSLAFNDHLGFRRNAALPFRPWDAGLGRPLRTLQLPTFCMDGSLFYGGASVDAALEQVERYLAAIKRVGGFGAIDWHVRTSLPANREYRSWGETYLAILDRLAADSELWVTSLDEVAAWVERRPGAA